MNFWMRRKTGNVPIVVIDCSMFTFLIFIITGNESEID